MPFYTPPADHSIQFKDDPDYVVPVIASFSTNGGVQPLYFQFDDNTIRIHSMHWCEKKYGVYHYECTAEMNGYLTEINLTFYPSDNKWTMKLR